MSVTSTTAQTLQTSGRPAVPPIIEVRGLVKRYGDAVAVDGIDLSVDEGEIFGILGPNGAGKTTTLEIIEGLRPPDAGTITVDGIDAVANSEAVRRLIGVQLQTTALFPHLSAAELIELFGKLYGIPTSPSWVETLLARVGLTEKRTAQVDQLSGGQRQRLSITIALVNEPRVVFLDEPTTGLDPAARRDLWALVQEVRAAGTTVVLTTHYMEEAEILCDRVAVMDRGRVIACDTPAALIRAHGGSATVRARIADGAFPAAALASLPAMVSAGEAGGRIELRTDDVQRTLVGLLDLASREGVTLADLNASQATLEDVFLALTGRAYETTEPARREDEEPGDETAKRRGLRR